MERCYIVHKSIIVSTQVKDYYKLLTCVKRIFRCVDLEYHPVLNQYMNRLDALNTETLWGIVYEVMLSYKLDSDSNMFTNYVWNTTSHKKRELNSLILECRDEATIRRYRNLKWKRDGMNDN